LVRNLDGSFNQPSIHLSLNESLTKGHQSAFAESGLTPALLVLFNISAAIITKCEEPVTPAQ
jgi:hypothetical protein